MANKLGTDLVHDSDSSDFSWMINEKGERVRNPEFPQNYVKHLKEAEKKYRFVLASTHKDVLKLLKNTPNTVIGLVHPAYNLKEEWLRRYDAREHNGFPKELLEKNWDNWFKDMQNVSVASRIALTADMHLMDVPLVSNSIPSDEGTLAGEDIRNAYTTFKRMFRYYSESGVWSTCGTEVGYNSLCAARDVYYQTVKNLSDTTSDDYKQAHRFAVFRALNQIDEACKSAVEKGFLTDAERLKVFDIIWPKCEEQKDNTVEGRRVNEQEEVTHD